MKEQVTNAALRQQIAQWTRAALGPLVEDDVWNDLEPNGEETTPSLSMRSFSYVSNRTFMKKRYTRIVRKTLPDTMLVDSEKTR